MRETLFLGLFCCRENVKSVEFTALKIWVETIELYVKNEKGYSRKM